MKLPFMDFVVGGVLVVCVAALGMLCCYCLKKERNSARLFNARLEAIVARMDGQPVPPVDVDQPLWYVRARGLAQSLIDGIKVVKYKKDVVGLVEGNECAICLSEFEENDSLRVLPKCGHAFHIPCVDQWFMYHSNCPLCRNPITNAMIVAGVPLATVTTEAVFDWARRNPLERANRAALGGLPLDGVAIGDEGTSLELSGSKSSESENGRNGLAEDKDSSFSGSSKVTVESDHPSSPIDKDFQLPRRRSISADPAIASMMNGYVPELRIQVNSDASIDSNSAPSGSTSKETSPVRDNKMARSASFGGSPSSGNFGSSQNPTLPY